MGRAAAAAGVRGGAEEGLVVPSSGGQESGAPARPNSFGCGEAFCVRCYWRRLRRPSWRARVCCLC